MKSRGCSEARKVLKIRHIFTSTSVRIFKASKRQAAQATNIFKSTSTKQSFHVFSKENYICCVNKVIKDLHQERPTRGGCIILECHASIVESYEMQDNNNSCFSSAELLTNTDKKRIINRSSLTTE